MLCSCGEVVARYSKTGLCNRCYKKQWYYKDIEKRRAQGREQALRHYRLHKNEISRRAWRRNQLVAIQAYGGKCQCPACPETRIEFLTIDHINNDGAEHRRSLGGFAKFHKWLRDNGYPKDNFQLLCMNCNWGKRRTGTCPHLQDPATLTDEELNGIRERINN